MATTDYLTVTALTQYLKRKFDMDPYLGKVYLTGEISNFRLRPHAHQYFSLKDDHAKINAIMFRSAFEKLKFTPETGMKVLVVGRISLYGPSGNYQVYVERMEPDGVGQLYQAYEQLKRKLASEGLFTAPKQALPRFPKRIAVVTSPSGAVIRDIMTTTKRRFPIAQIVLYPALVQGQEAADDIVRQITRANANGSFDTLIIGRGGGSIEDLWPFNEEKVARAIAASTLPVISSVGHETDTTIADLVADVRAATPTAAAELAVPVLSDELVKLQQQQTRLVNAMANRIKLRQERLNQLMTSYVFQQPQRLYETYVQRLDNAQQGLTQRMQLQLQQRQQRVQLVTQRLQSQTPLALVRQDQQQVTVTTERLTNEIHRYLTTQENRVAQLASGLDYLSPLKIMSRGYSYVTQDDQIIRQTAALKPGPATIHLSDGTAEAEIKTIKPATEAKHD
ncbi:exodeoxyribonuclease VII large subunit [Levilactobacillus suantsaii]|uniref:Exodeoxyribonuclease 7 large subunit n=2 Tax=Levilactobacillus suantsaii TaxID=2292255 RepID=A0A4Q0VLG8_9LACO|nr:exodeoxyribonuclease VII large subunit [Levilactobacillus suantsaii]QMU07774.1 exodeoxyribonuclease VII large subunit [Levilactobacillus suantsaii]RXI79402.1 exodeoxyribonuclease VII large subunit [Levilactobacillus suantsaii]